MLLWTSNAEKEDEELLYELLRHSRRMKREKVEPKMKRI
jgi:hypothetical protein